MLMIQEDSALISVKTAKTVSKEMDVFYNPIMKLNRDVSVLLLKALGREKLNIALPLAGSGIRGVRFLRELDKGVVESLHFNDYSKKAVSSIRKNLTLNKIKKTSKIHVHTEDANLFLLNSKGFDYIDIDPFGTSNPFLDSAIKRMSRDGILAVTNTDTAGLAGTYPAVCKRLYWGIPKLDAMKHETGLRILIRKIQLVGMQYDKALIPIFSYFKDHYFRVFFKCVKGKKECDSILKEHGMFNGAGPLWLGSLWDSKLASKMYSLVKKEFGLGTYSIKGNNAKVSTKKESIEENSKENKNSKNEEIKIIDNYKELVKFLEIIKDESKIKSVGFFDTHGKGKKTIIQKDVLIQKIKKKKYKASSTHFLGTAVRTNMLEKEIKKIIRK